MAIKINSASARISETISLNDISFNVGSGSVSVIVGPNGAGKTSLLRAICNDLRLQGGEIHLNGKSIKEWTPQERATFLGVLPQQSTLEFPFSVNEVVAMGRIPHSTSNAHNQSIVEEALALVDCSHLALRSFPSLSGGEKQRVQLARVAAQIWEAVDTGPRCLILDEPTVSLDLAHQELVAQMFNFFAEKGVAILVVLHDLNLAAKCASQILVLDKGGMVAKGTPEDVITQSMLADVFHISAKVISHPLDARPMVVT